VDSRLRVGGPATSNFRVVLPAGQTNATVDHQPTPDDVEALDWRPVWVEDFIAYCHTNQLPLDFISTHPYPQDFPLDDLVTGRTVRMKRGVDATKHDLSLLRRIVNGSLFPQAEIQLTEWSSSPSSRDFTHDCLPAAAFVAKANIESVGLVDSLSYWTFSDVFEEKGAGDTIFHGGFGIVNYQGIVKPTFHAYRFLNALGDEIIARTNGVIITRKKSTGKLTALVYHYPCEVKNSLPPSSSLAAAEGMLGIGTPIPLNLTLRGLRAKATILVETLDKSHGNAVEAWQRMGTPEPPTRKQTAQLRQAAEATNKEFLYADKHGQFVLKRQVEPWSLMLIQEQ
jgi:xylan 1,4-beta-xylosidase